MANTVRRALLLALWILAVCDAVKIDKKGYVMFCPCMGRFGNQADHFLGSLAFAKDLDRTLVLPPWVEYHFDQFRSVQVPFNTYFKVEALRKFHRVITMEIFMKTIAPTIWPPGDRAALCYTGRGGGEGCKAKEGNPFGSFWDTFKVDFDKSNYYGPLSFNTEDESTRKSWQQKFPASAHPALAFTGAPAAFPVASHNVHLHQYMVWSNKIDANANQFIDHHIGDGPYLGVHLRNGSDFRNACNHIHKGSHLFATPQCLGYNFEHGQVTDDLCFPPEATVIAQIKETAEKIQAKTVFVATDDDTIINKLTKLLKPLKVVHQTERKPHVDLALLARSHHFIGNCASSFSAFAARERKVKALPTSFWAFPIQNHEEL